MSSHKRNRRVVIASAGALFAAVSIAFAVPMAQADESAKPAKSDEHKANAEIMDPRCDVPAEHDPAVIKTLHDVGQERKINDKVMLAMFEAGWVESHMNNLDCGDSDSVGVFQQRPSMGWCDPADLCRDVPHATNAFLDQAIPNDENNPNYTAGELAQSVQRSAYPERYDQEEGKANELIKEASNA